ncbi:MAG: ATP-binding protein [Candidatus Palauibacterales bacterium]|nr:ATP-binding protein [Candidatus Palauibacterales bacterium]
MADQLQPLSADEAVRRCDPEQFDFSTTDDLDDLTEVIDQARAEEALQFGIATEREGFNIYALGPQETDKENLVRHYLEDRASEEDPPEDLCYVNNFDDPDEPRLLRVPAGVGKSLADDVDDFLRELRPALTSAFESEEYQTRRAAVQEEAGAEQQEKFQELQERANERGLALLRTPAGFVFAPIRDDEIIPPDEIQELSEEEQERLEEAMEELQEELKGILRSLPREQRKTRDRVQELNEEIARYTVRELLKDLRTEYGEYEAILDQLSAVEDDIVENVESVIGQGEGNQGGGGGAGGGRSLQGPVRRVVEHPALRRYRVNVLVDHGDSDHAPVVYEDNPTYQNLVGRIEYLAQMGALITDFNMIKSGALHEANGGYLMLDARQVLLQPYAWEALKRAVKSGEIRIDSLQEMLGMVSTVSLDPEPVEHDARIVLLGDRLLYYLLSEFDPEFGDLFKVSADFDDQVDRTEENERLYAGLIGSLIQKEELRPFDPTGVARVVERSARMVGDAEKLSVRSRGVLDLIREADHWAGKEDADAVTAEHVQTAIDKRIYRSDRLRERTQEEILRDTIYIDTEGEQVGQVNGLSVLQLGDFAFGRPTRITARTRLGKGEVVDIEREAELGGPIHSKGVMILSGFLGGRYATERPLSLEASLVFEQSYGGIEGDSASSTELYALLSSIAEVPVRQSVAVTGSVNQHGRIQPIGGVNEKIEGYFDVCEERGLNGEQGVLIPASNTKHLMLRRDVVEAIDRGEFHVWPVETVDQGMELLTGQTMGQRDEEGRYPEGTINYLVEERLAELADRRMEFAGPMDGEE